MGPPGGGAAGTKRRPTSHEVHSADPEVGVNFPGGQNDGDTRGQLGENMVKATKPTYLWRPIWGWVGSSRQHLSGVGSAGPSGQGIEG